MAWPQFGHGISRGAGGGAVDGCGAASVGGGGLVIGRHSPNVLISIAHYGTHTGAIPQKSPAGRGQPPARQERMHPQHAAVDQLGDAQIDGDARQS